MGKVTVSVLMAAYNSDKYISEAIESVLKQTYKDFEFIIVDDCSTDKTGDIIKKYAKKDKRIKAFRNEKNLGKPLSYNKLLSKINNKSKFFFFLGADDIINNNLIKVKFDYLNKNKNLSGLGSSIEYVNDKLKYIKKRVYPQKNEDIRKVFLIYSPFSQGGMFLRTELKHEKFNKKYTVSQDYELWTRLISKGYKFENLEQCLYTYRQHSEQGRTKNFKLIIWNTIKLKSRYVFKIEFFNFKAFFRLLGEIGLLILPKKVVSWLFYKIV
jgi:glycosyltransferase involved in cell wall biosynthesis